MHALFGVSRETGELVVIGRGRLDTNGISLDFGATLPYIGATLRPYIFFAPKALATHPTVTPELFANSPEVKVWANPVGKRKDHRPLIWIGWPLVSGSKGLAILKPAVGVKCPGLEAYEPKQDGFFVTLEGERRRGVIPAPVKRKAVKRKARSLDSA